MTTFVDTSALYALLDEDDERHEPAASWLSGPGRDPAEMLVSHNYVLVETTALVDRRLGRDAVRTFFDAFAPMLSVRFVDDALHRTALSAYLGRSNRRESLVDWVSFAMIEELAVYQAFAFDDDFSRRGIAVVP